MALTAAQIRELHYLAQALETAGNGQRGELIARRAALLGCAPKTVYAHLKKYAGWQSGRGTRADAGKTRVNEELALTVGGMVHMARRQNGKKTLSIKSACEILGDQGYGAVNPDTGEITMPKPETVARAMRSHYGCHPAQLAAASPAQRLRSLHPNHTWQVDASVCVLYKMRGSAQVRLLNERDYNEHKPGKLIEIAGQRIVRYVLTDHYSHNFYVHYEQARGEDALGVLQALMGGMCDRGPRDPMHGVPSQVNLDPGSGNKSSLVLQFLERLEVKALHHAPGNARATGSVECCQNIVECGFESRLRFMDVPSVTELQVKADAWRRHYLATAMHSRTKASRNAVWLCISEAELRTVTRPVLEAVAAWGDVTRRIDNHFRISVDTKAFGVREYDLRELGYHGINAKDVVSVRLNPFKAPVITVIKALPDGTELLFDVPPVEVDAAGFDVSAPVIGGEYKALPETRSEKALKKIKQMAYGTDSVEEAEKAHKAKNRQPFAHIDINADIREAPLHFRQQGAPLNLDAPVAKPMPLNHVQAASRLRQMCAEAWNRDAVGCMDMLKGKYPAFVPETSLDELAAAINARFAPRPATILSMPTKLQGGAACASA